MARFVVRSHSIGKTHEIIHDSEAYKRLDGEYKATVLESFDIPDSMSLEEAVKLYKAGVRPKR